MNKSLDKSQRFLEFWQLETLQCEYALYQRI